MTDSTELAIRKAEAAAYAQTLREDRHYSRDQIMLSLASFLDKCASEKPCEPLEPIVRVHPSKEQAESESRSRVLPCDPQPPAVHSFWLVWNEQASAPKKKHAAEPEAIAEAERLAERHKCRVVVLKSVCEFNPSGVKRTDHATQ